MKRSFMRSRNDAKLRLSAGPYSRRPLYFPIAAAAVRGHKTLKEIS